MTHDSVNREKDTQLSPVWLEGSPVLRQGLQQPRSHSPWHPENGETDWLFVIWLLSPVYSPLSPPPAPLRALTLVFFFFILKTLDAIWMVDRVSA